MEVLKQRTRLLISDYTDREKTKLEDYVARMDNVYLYYDPDKGTIGVPPGFEKTLKEKFKNVTIKDDTNSFWPYSTITPVVHNAEPRNQLQKDFIEFALDNISRGQKIAGILGCGSGKTFMACYIAIKVGLKTLIIVPTSSIKIQWGETLIKMFNVDQSRVKVVNSPKDFINTNADFAVVSHASLASINKNYDLEKIIKNNKFGITIIDEAQMFFKNIIMIESSSNIKNTLFLTGTWGRSDEIENNLYQTMFEDIKIFREKMKTPTFWDRRPGNVYGQRPYHQTRIIWTNSGLTSEQLKSINTAKTYSEREGMWVRYGINVGAYMNLVIPPDGTVTRFVKTLIKVVKMAESECPYGSTLILLPTIQCCKTMINHLKPYFPDKKIGTINSLQSKAENQKNKVESDILVSTIASCGTGFDKVGLAKVLLFAPTKSWINVTQIFYRNRRRSDGKDVWMWDVIDSCSGQLKRWGNERVNIYREKSKKLKVISI